MPHGLLGLKSSPNLIAYLIGVYLQNQLLGLKPIQNLIIDSIYFTKLTGLNLDKTLQPVLFQFHKLLG